MRARVLHVARLALALIALPSLARSHALAPSYLELREEESGRVAVLWRTPRLATRGAWVEPVLPARCTASGVNDAQADAATLTLRSVVDCGAAGLIGAELAARGLASSRTTVLVRVVRADGSELRTLLSERAPRWTVPSREHALDVLWAYACAGSRHLAAGIDHLLFLGGLLLLLPTRRRVVVALSAFTLGHAATLALATTGWLALPGPLVEPAIAASLVLVAAEAAALRTDPAPGRLGRRPGLLCLGFGLVHGLGFAGVLRGAGLPPGSLPLALAGFHLGIEAAQLAFVGLALGAAAAVRGAAPRIACDAARSVAVHAIGAAGVALLLDRLWP